jgi:hypothetical protein
MPAINDEKKPGRLSRNGPIEKATHMALFATTNRKPHAALNPGYDCQVECVLKIPEGFHRQDKEDQQQVEV